VGTGAKLKLDGETDQDLVPEQEDEVEEEHPEAAEPGGEQQQRVRGWGLPWAWSTTTGQPCS